MNFRFQKKREVIGSIFSEKFRFKDFSVRAGIHTGCGGSENKKGQTGES
jgi:hypothetical protein